MVEGEVPHEGCGWLMVGVDGGKSSISLSDLVALQLDLCRL